MLDVNQINTIMEVLNNSNRVSSYDITFDDKNSKTIINVYLVENGLISEIHDSQPLININRIK